MKTVKKSSSEFFLSKQVVMMYAGAERQFLKMEDLARNKDEAACEEAKVALAKCLDESVLQKSVLQNYDAPGKIRLANERTLWPR
jgi:hypothetical protein